MSATFATAPVDGVPLRLSYFAEWREGLPHPRNGARYPAVRVEYRVTGERRQAGPLRARHFRCTRCGSTGADPEHVGPCGLCGGRLPRTSRPAWRTSQWVPLTQWPDGSMSWRLTLHERGAYGRPRVTGQAVHLTADFVAWTRVALDHWLETGAALEWAEPPKPA